MPKDNDTQSFSEDSSQQAPLVRLAKESDIPAILTVERASFSLPWSETALRSEFRNPYSRVWVLEEKAEIIGYLCAWFIDSEGQIANVAVLPVHRQGGRGSKLVQYALQEAREQGVQVLSLEVRSSNIVACKLYARFGFHKVAVRKRYYENGEDALLMLCHLS